MLVDSTNAEVPGFTTPERDIAPVLDRVFAQASKRVIVACFASHVHRVQQVLDAAAAHGRKVAFVGRSMVRNMGVARDLGYLHVPGGLMVDVKQLDDLPDDKIVLICTGSQGEPMSALSRIANRDHFIRIGEGDTVVLASSLIPGNENSVYRVINGLTRWGAEVVHKANAMVHVSGHASAGELLYLYNIVRPSNVMPVHGEWRHLRANADLAAADRRPARPHRAWPRTASWSTSSTGGHRSSARCRAATSTSTAPASATSPKSSLKDRRILRDEGFISVVVVVDSVTGKVAGGPEIHARGFAEDDSVFDGVRGRIEEALEQAAGEGIGDSAPARSSSSAARSASGSATPTAAAR